MRGNKRQILTAGTSICFAALLLLAALPRVSARVSRDMPEAAAFPAAVEVTPTTTPATYILVEATERDTGMAAKLAELLAAYDVTAVYSAGDKRGLQRAQPIADMLGVARIPYDFGAEPDLFAQHLLSGSLSANFGRVAVLVLAPSLIQSFVAHVSAGQMTETDLAAGEMFVVEIAGTITRVRVD